MHRFLALSCLSIFALSALPADQYGFPDSYPEVYDNVDVMPLNRHGWYLHEKFKDIFAQKNIQVAVEVGTWLGNCAIYLAEMLPENGKIFCVDHWLGSAEHRDPHNYGEYALLPTLFRQFLSNIILTKQTDKVIPVRTESLQAVEKFRELNIRPDLVYIDASHDYNSVYNDIRAWHSILNEDGILCGDDWNLGGVPRAVRDYAAYANLKVCFGGEFWWYEKAD